MFGLLLLFSIPVLANDEATLPAASITRTDQVPVAQGLIMSPDAGEGAIYFNSSTKTPETFTIDG